MGRYVKKVENHGVKATCAWHHNGHY